MYGNLKKTRLGAEQRLQRNRGTRGQGVGGRLLHLDLRRGRLDSRAAPAQLKCMLSSFLCGVTKSVIARRIRVSPRTCWVALHVEYQEILWQLLQYQQGTVSRRQTHHCEQKQGSMNRLHEHAPGVHRSAA
jgi:hypothetical protein